MKHKQIDQIISDYFFLDVDDVDLEFTHYNLCKVFNRTLYENSWERFWFKINTRNYIYMSDYLKQSTPPEAALLRLLVVEDFKKYVKQEEGR
jgi:hypothetical protein